MEYGYLIFLGLVFFGLIFQYFIRPLLYSRLLNFLHDCNFVVFVHKPIAFEVKREQERKAREKLVYEFDSKQLPTAEREETDKILAKLRKIRQMSQKNLPSQASAAFSRQQAQDCKK